MIWVLVFLGLAVFYSIVALPKDWRGQGFIRYGSFPKGSLLGAVVFNGWVRTGPYGVVSFSIVVLGALILEGLQNAGHPLPILGRAWAVVGFLWLASIVALFVFNKPALLVPPHLRSKPGALQEWLRLREQSS